MHISKFPLFRTKVRELAATLPDHMSGLRDELHDIANQSDTMDHNEAKARLADIASRVKAAAGAKGAKVPGFPRAAGARKAVFDLEDMLNHMLD